METKYRSIFISDIHLGTNDAKTDHLNNFLKHNSCETLYLVGDIIDGWKIQKNRFKWKQSHSNVVRRILGLAKHNKKVIYIAGNHDEFLRPMIGLGISFGKISIHNQYTHIGLDGKRYLVVHGDMFDGITRLAPWISFLGDKAYDIVLYLNNKFNWIRRKFGFGYWSLSKYLKDNVKAAVSFMVDFENEMARQAKKRNCHTVVCGHIHTPSDKDINGVHYLNCGDWVENCSYIVLEKNKFTLTKKF